MNTTKYLSTWYIIPQFNITTTKSQSHVHNCKHKRVQAAAERNEELGKKWRFRDEVGFQSKAGSSHRASNKYKTSTITYWQEINIETMTGFQNKHKVFISADISFGKTWSSIHLSHIKTSVLYLASQDALEVMRVTYLLTYLLTESLSNR